MIDLDTLVPGDHLVRKLQKAIDWKRIQELALPLYSHLGRSGISRPLQAAHDQFYLRPQFDAGCLPRMRSEYGLSMVSGHQPERHHPQLLHLVSKLFKTLPGNRHQERIRSLRPHRTRHLQRDPSYNRDEGNLQEEKV